MHLARSAVWIPASQAEDRAIDRRALIIRVALIVALPAILIWLGLDVQFMIDQIPMLVATIPLVLQVSFWAIVLACILGLVGALGRLSSRPLFYVPARFYVSFFQGIPVIVVLFLLYFGLPQLNSSLVMTSLQAGAIGLGLQNGAWLTEVFRSSIESVPAGQMEAAKAIGMSYRQAMWRVVLPQASRNAVAPTANYYIFIVKDTSLVGFLGVAELFATARSVGQRDFKVLEMLILAGLVYWALTTILSALQSRLERRLGRAYVRES